MNCNKVTPVQEQNRIRMIRQFCKVFPYEQVFQFQSNALSSQFNTFQQKAAACDVLLLVGAISSYIVW
jgi:hypothetical protein